MEKRRFREATERDLSLILCFLIELDICGIKRIVDLDEKSIYDFFFVKNKGRIVFALEDSMEVGLAIYIEHRILFYTWEQLKIVYVIPEYRHKGYGEALKAQS